ncbi:MAG: HAD family hydrolase [Marinifilaceae bacterium]|jgi:D-glycero-D-manno-heptose 1,7-bisphosphate phosphatase|nr:HAD family hydrolase [Marinifilaceae bacterium]
MHKAVFLDRDGVINNDTGKYYTYKVEDFIINKDIIESISLLKQNKFKVIVVTNQGGIAKGIYTSKEVNKVHEYLQNILKNNNCYIDDFYFCPHHDSIEQCDCRKPSPKMILEAAKKHNIDLSASYLIGDSKRDIEAGDAANLKKSYKINANESIYNICRNIINKNC